MTRRTTRWRLGAGALMVAAAVCAAGAAPAAGAGPRIELPAPYTTFEPGELFLGASVKGGNGLDVPGALVRWRIEGPSATSATSRVPQDGGEALVHVRRAGPGANTVTAHFDADEDGAIDEGEPVGSTRYDRVAPGPGLQVIAPRSPVPPRTTVQFPISIRTAEGKPVANADMIVVVRGAGNEFSSFTTDPDGLETGRFLGESPGTDQVTVAHDVNDNSNIDEGEPARTFEVEWREGAPPPRVVAGPGAPPPPPPPPPGPAAASTRPATAGAVRRTRSGRLDVTLRCPARGGRPCSGRLTVSRRGRVARRTYRLAPGTVKGLRLRARFRVAAGRKVRVDAGARTVLRRVRAAR